MEKEQFYVCSKETCFSYYGCVPSEEAARVGSLSVFNGESEFNPHVCWVENAVLRPRCHLCDIRLSSGRAAGDGRGWAGGGGLNFPCRRCWLEHSRILLILHAKGNVRPEVLIYGVGFGDSDLQI